MAELAQHICQPLGAFPLSFRFALHNGADKPTSHDKHLAWLIVTNGHGNGDADNDDDDGAIMLVMTDGGGNGACDGDDCL